MDIMDRNVLRYAFVPSVRMQDVEETLLLAMLAVESLHGEDRVRLETQFSVDQANSTVIIDATSDLGRTLALLFGGYARREFGAGAFLMQHVKRPKTPQPAGVAS
jgi:hypothetical protein